MAKTPAANYTAVGTDFQIPGADTDQFDRDDVAKLGKAVDDHDHSGTRGVAVKRIQSGTLAARPAGAAGWVYYATDTNQMFAHDGTDWREITPGTGSITTAKLADGAVTSAKIADGTIVDADISATASIAQSKISNAVRAVDADKVDGYDAGNAADNVLKLDASGLVPLGNIPANLTGKNADTVDGAHAGTGADNVLKLDASGKVPLANNTDNVVLHTQIAKVRVQTGTVAFNAGSTVVKDTWYTITWTFPTAFKAATTPVVVVSIHSSLSADDIKPNFYIHTLSNTSVGVRMIFGSAANPTPVLTAHLIAIGEIA